ncbi:MAG: hypothetical protein VW496_00345 [Pelagibacteraceae bacterium]
MVAGLARLIAKGGKEIASEMEDLFSSAAKREARDVPDAPTPVAREIPDAPVEEIDTSYRGQHQPKGPENDYPVRLDNVTRSVDGEEAGFPDDFYSSVGRRYYAPPARSADDEFGIANTESYDAIIKAKDNPDAEVTIYRAVPNRDDINTINRGDFVTLSPRYAELHAGGGYGEIGGKVISKKVKVQDLYFDGNDVNEFGYFPKRTTVKEIPEVDESVNLSDVLDYTDESIETWQKQNKHAEAGKRRYRNEELEKAAQDLYKEKITEDEFKKLRNQLKPLKVYNTVPDLYDPIDIRGALGKNAEKFGIIGVNRNIKKNTRVTSRFDIKAYETYDVYAVTVYDVSGPKNVHKGFSSTAVLKNVEFGYSPEKSFNIAQGKNKSPFATMEGDWQNVAPESAKELAEDALKSGEWTEVGFDPAGRLSFYNRETGDPVFEADEVIQVGPMVLAKGIKTPTKEQMDKLIVKTKSGNPVSYNEGGMAMNQKTISKQMELFQEGGLVDQGGEVDMESGNEVPTGSLKEEVRDDIPANLSEGEFVMPAYAVRYHGIDKMMELVDEAKVKLERLNQMGMMGNSEEATLPDDSLLEGGEVEQEPMNYQTGGYVAPAVGAPVQPYVPGQTVYTPPPAASTIQRQPSTVASQFNIQPASQAYQQQPGYTPPMIQPVPIQQRQVVPRFKDYLISSQGKYDELREYVNDAGNTLMIPFIQGKPIYPIPEGYRRKSSDSVTTQPDKVTTTTTQVTKQDSDDGGFFDDSTTMGENQANIGGLSPGEVASGITADQSAKNKTGLSLSELNNNPMAKIGLGFALGGPMGAGAAIVGLAAKDLFGFEIPSITSLASKVFSKPETQLSQTELDQIGNLTSLETQGSIADALGVDSLSGNYGNNPGDIDAATGGIFNDRGIAMAIDITGRVLGQATGPDDDLPSFTGPTAWGAELSASRASGWWGGPLSDLEVSQLDTEGKLNYSKYLSETGRTQEALDLSLEAFNEDYEQSDLGKQDAADAEAYGRGPTEDPTEAPTFGDDPTSTSEAEAAAAAAEAEASAAAKEDTLNQDEKDEEQDSEEAAAAAAAAASEASEANTSETDYGAMDGDDTDGGDGGDSCVIATHAISTNSFTKRDRAKAVAYCKKKYHGKWYGELFRQGYQHLGKKAIERGVAPNHYDEFKNFILVGTGHKTTTKNKLNFYLRTVQFFLVGCYLKIKG